MRWAGLKNGSWTSLTSRHLKCFKWASLSPTSTHHWVSAAMKVQLVHYWEQLVFCDSPKDTSAWGQFEPGFAVPAVSMVLILVLLN